MIVYGLFYYIIQAVQNERGKTKKIEQRLCSEIKLIR